MDESASNQTKYLYRLQKLLEIGVALSTEQDYQKLLEMILGSAKELTNADGGTLYTVRSDDKLHFEIVRTDSLKLAECVAAAPPPHFADIPIFDSEGKPNDHKVSVYTYTHRCSVNISDVYATDDQFDFSGPKQFDQTTGYHTHSLLAVPLKNPKQEVLGVIQLLNAKDAEGNFVPFSDEDQSFLEYFASIASAAITNNRLVREQREMFQALEKVLNIGVALSCQRDHDKLLEMILVNAKELTNADGGTLYTVTRDKKLHFEIVRTDSLNIKWGGSALKGENAPVFQDIPLYDSEGKPNDRLVAVYAVTQNCTVNVPDAYSTEDLFDFSGTRKFDEKTGYHSKSFLTVPLQNHEQETIGVLQLINAKDKCTDKLIAFSKNDQHLVESFASQAAVAMTNERLVQELRALFEALIKMLVDAIDEKSPITGKHCKRVPIISDLLAKAVNETHEGELKDVQLSASDLYELNIAALLHDCGKVVTPVHVVEKSKKLETITDRIHLLDTRFELLRRDVRIRNLEEKLKLIQGTISDKQKAAFDQLDEQERVADEKLKEDRELLHRCNKGGEAMAPEWQQRVHELAQVTWEDENHNIQPFITDDELKNLLIARGTLTQEEREIIQNHVVMTIRMLRDIPYPKYLREVPEIAGKHHERIDGKGYPLGLTGSQMSLRARILAIADVFEALTAPDRPYKECMPLSTALRILEKMKNEGHIDPTLYDVFMNQKVYLKYAHEYLKPEQIDVT